MAHSIKILPPTFSWEGEQSRFLISIPNCLLLLRVVVPTLAQTAAQEWGTLGGMVHSIRILRPIPSGNGDSGGDCLRDHPGDPVGLGEGYEAD
jgi:hypothetical protein